MPNIKADLEVLQQARPYLRGGIALLIYLCSGSGRYKSKESCFSEADYFIQTLERDVKNA